MDRDGALSVVNDVEFPVVLVANLIVLVLVSKCGGGEGLATFVYDEVMDGVVVIEPPIRMFDGHPAWVVSKVIELVRVG